MTIAIIIILLVIGSIIFHFVSPWWFTPLASNWGSIDNTINITLWVTGIVFVLVNMFLAFAIIRYRHNKNRRAHYEPENTKLESILTIITTIGVAGMLIPGLFVWGDFITVPEEADEVEVVGQQWHWSYRFPGEDKKFGKVATALISEKNPFGLDSNDPNSLDDVLISSNELHLPVDRPVKVTLRSKDVLHNFAVPQFRVKMDLVPGIISYFWFTPTKIGRFEILCEELCGMAHFTMRGHVEVDSAEDYQHWLSQQKNYAQLLASPSGDTAQGKKIFAACTSCHGENGEGNKTFNAPQLAGLSQWYLTRQLKYYQNKTRGDDERNPFGQQMQAMSALLPDENAVKNVAAYLSALPALQPSFSDKKDIVGNTIKGKELYINCAYCHGEQGQGNYTTNAPKLAGQHSWYLKQQLLNYRQGIRGSNYHDLYGSQMQLMSKTLYDEQAIDDVLAYIASLATNVQSSQ